MHYDHVGTFFDFPNAVFHIQDDEMSFVTGRYMRHARFAHSFEPDDVVGMVRMLFKGRVVFHKGAEDLAPGLSLHHIGGHTPGLQSVRVHTRRGWVVLASDATHYYEHLETGRCFPSIFNLGHVLEGYDTLRRLADSPRHIIPGHDPLVMARYPAVSRSSRASKSGSTSCRSSSGNRGREMARSSASRAAFGHGRSTPRSCA
jgi:glyoxylase-like metal-dependent hydrolase (beta-lactamase superfamily II)